MPAATAAAGVVASPTTAAAGRAAARAARATRSNVASATAATRAASPTARVRARFPLCSALFPHLLCSHLLCPWVFFCGVRQRGWRWWVFAQQKRGRVLRVPARRVRPGGLLPLLARPRGGRQQRRLRRARETSPWCVLRLPKGRMRPRGRVPFFARGGRGGRRDLQLVQLDAFPHVQLPFCGQSNRCVMFFQFSARGGPHITFRDGQLGG